MTTQSESALENGLIKTRPCKRDCRISCENPFKNHRADTGVSIDMNDPAIIEAGVKFFPTILIFSPDSELIFRGDLEDCEEFITNAFKN